MTTMTHEQVAKAVVDVCQETLRLPREVFVPEAKFIEDLEVDSLYLVQLAIAVEEEFKIQVSEEDSRSLVTLQDMVDLIYLKLTTDDGQVSSTQRPPAEPTSAVVNTPSA
jgi:acyl carrier protein